MIRLRPLEEKDAPLMLEWMHDGDIQKRFQKNMMEMTIQDTTIFCQRSKETIMKNDGSIHFAIVDDTDEYLGTISLKDLDLDNKNAEYAISTRKKVHGTGIAKVATGLILKKAFEEYGLHRVYLNVLSDNIPAICFYEKCGFRYEGEFRDCLIKDGEYTNLKWFSILKKEFKKSDFELQDGV